VEDDEEEDLPRRTKTTTGMPSLPWILDVLGHIYYRKKDFRTALKWYEEVHRMKSEVGAVPLIVNEGKSIMTTWLLPHSKSF